MADSQPISGLAPSSDDGAAPVAPEREHRQNRVGTWAPVAVVAAVSFAVYANALGNGLHVDDQYQIVTNPWIRSFRNLPTIFSSGVWDFDGRVSSYYRPMMYVLYSIVYAFAGTAAWAYHLLNVVMNAGAAVLAFLVARVVLERDNACHPWWRSPALLVGLLFAAHPIHTEPVAWAAGIVDVSYAFFYLLAFYFAARDGATGRVPVAGLAAYAAALFSKEPAITLPVLLLVYWGLRDGRELGLGGLARRLAPWLAVSAAYIVARRLALGGLAPQTSDVNLTPWEYVLTACALVGRFLRSAVLPLELNFWHVFEPVRSLWSAEAAFALLTVGAWAGLFVWALRRRALAPAVALAFAILPLTPALFLRSLNQGLENAFAERYVYLPSFGILLLAGWAVAALEPGRARLARALAACLVVLAAAGAVASVQRNPVWRDAVSLWGDAAGKSPESGLASLNYGFALLSASQNDAGRRQVERAVALAPELIQREVDRAVSLAQADRSGDAILAFHTVLLLDPRSSLAHYNLGVLYEQRGQISPAMTEYEAAVALDPTMALAHNNLGILYAESGDRVRALEHLEEAARLEPTDPAFRANLRRAQGR
jgi:tetratricopeptide (TPR) repeat protein